jgi:fibro-slime domain-containing protein
VLSRARWVAVLLVLGCARQPRSLLIVEIDSADPGLTFAQIRVRASGVERTESGEVPQKIGVYLPASVEGPVTATAEGLDGRGVPIAAATSETVTIHPGETHSVSVKLARLPGGAGPDGGSGPDAAVSGTGGSPATGGSPGTGGSSGTGGSPATGGAPGTGGVPATGGSSGTGGTGLPPDFVPADVGGYKARPPMPDTGLPDTEGCGQWVGVARDFKSNLEAGGHPDFERFAGNGTTMGLVENILGPDLKPVYVPKCEAGGASGACPFGPQTTTKANFDQWYRSATGVNQPFLVYLAFEPVQGTSVFASKHFFPLDGLGWGNFGRDAQGKLHNFAFTTEWHVRFKYRGGESFTFNGDDDVWVFINRKLALDLGGLHIEVSGRVDLDKVAGLLGITPGNVYPLDLFHAERHTTDSDFRIESNLLFVGCGTAGN